MKKIIIPILLFSMFVLTTFTLHAGIPHAVYAYVYESDGTTHPPIDAITLEAFIEVRPDEVLTQESADCEYGTPDGLLKVQVGNFPTSWCFGDVINVTVYNNGDEQVGSVSLTYSGYDQMDPIIFNIAIEQPEIETSFINNQLMNQPNPFSSITTINYAIKGMLKSENVKISFYNTIGQLVLEDLARNGVYQFDASDLATGIYFYKIETKNFNKFNKMMIMR